MADEKKCWICNRTVEEVMSALEPSVGIKTIEHIDWTFDICDGCIDLIHAIFDERIEKSTYKLKPVW